MLTTEHSTSSLIPLVISTAVLYGDNSLLAMASGFLQHVIKCPWQEQPGYRNQPKQTTMFVTWRQNYDLSTPRFSIRRLRVLSLSVKCCVASLHDVTCRERLATRATLLTPSPTEHHNLQHNAYPSTALQTQSKHSSNDPSMKTNAGTEASKSYFPESAGIKELEQCMDILGAVNLRV